MKSRPFNILLKNDKKMKRLYLAVYIYSNIFPAWTFILALVFYPLPVRFSEQLISPKKSDHSDAPNAIRFP